MARTNDFLDYAHIEYDISIRTLAEEIGFAAFSAVNRGTSVLYYGAQNKRHKNHQFSNSKKSGYHGKRPCPAWSGEQGCPRSEDECRFGHICSKCNAKGHKRPACRE